MLSFFFSSIIFAHPACCLALYTLPAGLFTTCLFVPVWSSQASPISWWDIKEVLGASKSAGLRDKPRYPGPQLLFLIKPPGWLIEGKGQWEWAGRLARNINLQTKLASAYCLSLCSNSLERSWELDRSGLMKFTDFFFSLSNMLTQMVHLSSYWHVVPLEVLSLK